MPTKILQDLLDEIQKKGQQEVNKALAKSQQATAGGMNSIRFGAMALSPRRNSSSTKPATATEATQKLDVALSRSLKPAVTPHAKQDIATPYQVMEKLQINSVFLATKLYGSASGDKVSVKAEGDLFDKIQPLVPRTVSHFDKLPTATITRYIAELLLGIAAIHQRGGADYNLLAHNAEQGPGAVHRDIKPANVLMEQDHCRIADFDFLCQADFNKADNRVGFAGTKGFIHPVADTFTTHDVARYQQLDMQKFDIYALGVTIYQLTSNAWNYLDDATSAAYIKDFHLYMTAQDVTRIPNIAALLQHPLFALQRVEQFNSWKPRDLLREYANELYGKNHPNPEKLAEFVKTHFKSIPVEAERIWMHPEFESTFTDVVAKTQYKEVRTLMQQTQLTMRDVLQITGVQQYRDTHPRKTPQDLLNEVAEHEFIKNHPNPQKLAEFQAAHADFFLPIWQHPTFSSTFDHATAQFAENYQDLLALSQISPLSTDLLLQQPVVLNYERNLYLNAVVSRAKQDIHLTLGEEQRVAQVHTALNDVSNLLPSDIAKLQGLVEQTQSKLRAYELRMSCLTTTEPSMELVFETMVSRTNLQQSLQELHHTSGAIEAGKKKENKPYITTVTRAKKYAADQLTLDKQFAALDKNIDLYRKANANLKPGYSEVVAIIGVRGLLQQQANTFLKELTSSKQFKSALSAKKPTPAQLTLLKWAKTAKKYSVECDNTVLEEIRKKLKELPVEIRKLKNASPETLPELRHNIVKLAQQCEQLVTRQDKSSNPAMLQSQLALIKEYLTQIHTEYSKTPLPPALEQFAKLQRRITVLENMTKEAGKSEAYVELRQQIAVEARALHKALSSTDYRGLPPDVVVQLDQARNHTEQLVKQHDINRASMLLDYQAALLAHCISKVTYYQNSLAEHAQLPAMPQLKLSDIYTLFTKALVAVRDEARNLYSFGDAVADGLAADRQDPTAAITAADTGRTIFNVICKPYQADEGALQACLQRAYQAFCDQQPAPKAQEVTSAAKFMERLEGTNLYAKIDLIAPSFNLINTDSPPSLQKFLAQATLEFITKSWVPVRQEIAVPKAEAPVEAAVVAQQDMLIMR